MPRIRNYTSTVPANRSIMEIEKRLVSAQCTNIVKTYEHQQISGLYFTVTINGRDIPFRLPARVNRIQEQLLSNVRRPRKETTKRITEQAERTAWKLLADWIDVQLTLVELGQAEMGEIFLPYVYDHKTKSTVYERISSGELKLLN